MNNRIVFVLYIFLILMVFNSCTDRSYDVQVDGFVYEDCSLKPISNLSISLLNERKDNIKEVRTRTDSNGHFSLHLKGEGQNSIFLDIEGIYYGSIQSCQVYVYNIDTAELVLNKGSMNITDTLYVSFYNYYFFDKQFPINDSLLFKIEENDFNPWAHIKMNRKNLLPINFNPWERLNKLWIENNLEVYMVWGNGIKDFKNSVNLFNNKQFNSTSKIKKVQLKSCLNLNQINL